MNASDVIKTLIRFRGRLKDLPPEEYENWQMSFRKNKEEHIKEDHALIESLRSLDANEAEVLAVYALHLYDSRRHDDDPLPAQLLAQIATFREGSLRSLYPAIIAREMYWPSVLYYRADGNTRDTLLAHAAKFNRDSWEFGKMIEGIAWIGDEVVLHQIREWRKNPPIWQTSSYLSFDDFEIEAAWEIDNSARRRDLFFSKAYELLPVADSMLSDQQLVGAFYQNRVKCHWCSNNLDILFDIKMSEMRTLFPDHENGRLVIAYCPLCSPNRQIYTDFDLAGNYGWSPMNSPRPRLSQRASWTPVSLVGRQLIIGKQKRTSVELHGPLHRFWRSQIGGIPNWVQRARYPFCPHCHKRMKYFGQVEVADVIEQGEGVMYCFLCLTCLQATVSFQQT